MQILSYCFIAPDDAQFVIHAQVVVKAGDIRLVAVYRVGNSFAAAGAEGFALFAIVCVSYQTSAFETPDFHNSAILSLSGIIFIFIHPLISVVFSFFCCNPGAKFTDVLHPVHLQVNYKIFDCPIKLSFKPFFIELSTSAFHMFSYLAVFVDKY